MKRKIGSTVTIHVENIPYSWISNINNSWRDQITHLEVIGFNIIIPARSFKIFLRLQGACHFLSKKKKKTHKKQSCPKIEFQPTNKPDVKVEKQNQGKLFFTTVRSTGRPTSTPEDGKREKCIKCFREFLRDWPEIFFFFLIWCLSYSGDRWLQ